MKNFRKPIPEVSKILIVDDQPTDIQVPYTLAVHLGYKVTLAFDGRAALDEAVKTNYRFIVLDWYMPDMSGGDFLKGLTKLHAKYRSWAPTEMPKIVLYTGESVSNLMEAISSSGAYSIIDVWKKPLSPVEMLKRIKEIEERLVA